MSIIRGDFVRPNNPGVGLPRDSVWRVICTAGALKLVAENDAARRYDHKATGRRFHNSNFDKVVLCRGQWVDAREAVCLRYPDRYPDSCSDDVVPELTEGSCASPQNMPKPDAVTVAARAAKAKADKEAAARAQVEEARKELAAKLHADRCLGEATLALIAEVFRLNSGGSEQVAHSSIAAHCDQLQPLARSYGYRIAKPSMIALVVKL